MDTKVPVYLIVFVLKLENIQCDFFKIVRIVDIENPMGIKLFHCGSKVPKNKKALREKGLKCDVLSYFI